MKSDNFIEKHFKTANELWDALSPTKELSSPPYNFIYRGQADANWQLIPLVLREAQISSLHNKPKKLDATEQIYREIRLLELFVDGCDQIGFKVPNDSISFREEIITTQKQDPYYIAPYKWPNTKLFEVMALAQHHGVPTRLLDWSTIPYVAIYFAMSGALSRIREKKEEITTDDRLAIWCLNIEAIHQHPNLKLIKVPNSISPHLSAQSGVFTVQSHNGKRHEEFEIKGLEKEFCNSPNSPLLKYTLPLKESVNLHRLCIKSGFTGASIFSTPDGAGKLTTDSVNLEFAKKIFEN